MKSKINFVDINPNVQKLYEYKQLIVMITQSNTLRNIAYACFNMRLTKSFSSFKKYPFLAQLGLKQENEGAYYNGEWRSTNSQTTYSARNPATEQTIATIKCASLKDYETAIDAMQAANVEWRNVTMPVRGDIVRQIGDAFRAKKEPLGRLISLQMGKILSEGLGEVQQTIDVCDMACGLSRTIGGTVFNSQRPEHFMMQSWNPLGTVGVITAFNFPNAVFAWNAAIAWICGNTVAWKGAPTSSLVTLASANIVREVLLKNKINPNVLTVLQGGADIGQAMSKDTRIPLLSFTGSSKVGGIIRSKVEQRFGKVLLQLGGNNATIIMDDANLEMAFKACTFAAVGTCGQRCTSLRRLLIHEKVYDEFVAKLVKAYSTIKIGDPLEAGVLCGPLNNQAALDGHVNGLARIQKEGGKILYGGKRVNSKGYFVEPTIVQAPKNAAFLQQEFFSPILFVQKFKNLTEAIEINNNVPQGLSSSLFTQNISNAFKWVGPNGSDCGIANVNIGPSGAEIGGAFGGEKHTGGGRESGSDSWKQYMRRSTCTFNYGNKMPLAQGVNFDL